LSALFGGITSIDEIELSEEEREKIWKGFQASLDDFGKQYEGKQWYEGETISFADFAVAGGLLWIKILYGEESEIWGRVKSWNEGKWENLLQGLSEYQKNDS
jgi:glutathione S-transferase